VSSYRAGRCGVRHPLGGRFTVQPLRRSRRGTASARSLTSSCIAPAPSLLDTGRVSGVGRRGSRRSDVDDCIRPSQHAQPLRDVVRELLAQSIGPLPPAQRFAGAGIYALYYAGPDPLYAAVSDAKCRRGPIYVGKSRPAKNVNDAPLYGRLRDHATSIGQAPNLNLGDFRCRYDSCSCVG
jgi:hypothetical protein